MSEEQVQPIIVKKVIQGGGHHGGAWKVAYADFVTAMMAFFLLLWLLNVTTDEQKKGIADYFAPSSVSRSQSGSGGIMGGQTMSKDGARIGDAAAPTVVVEITPPRVRDSGEADKEQEDEPEENEHKKKTGEENDGDLNKGKNEETETEREKFKEPTQEELREKLAQDEQKAFEQAEQELREVMEDSSEFEELKRHLIVDNTPEGLRIQIVDQDGRSMFPSGSAEMHGHTQKILEQVSKVVATMPNNLSITGHTDSVPFRSGGQKYGNWELSSDRANASRRSLMDSGIPAVRIARVSGLADTEPLISEDPAHPSNRRISIVLLRRAAPFQSEKPDQKQ